MFEVFPLHDWVSNHRGIVSRGLVDNEKIAIKFRPTVDDTGFEIFKRFGGLIRVFEPLFDVVPRFSYMAKQIIECRHIVGQDTSIPCQTGALPSFRQIVELLQYGHHVI